MSEPRPAIRRLRERKERHKRRGRAYRIGFGTVGAVILLAGVVLALPGVPGPGLLLVAIGLGMLALEFDRAERLLERIIDRVEETRERTSLPAQVLTATVGLLVLAGSIVALVVWGFPSVP